MMSECAKPATGSPPRRPAPRPAQIAALALFLPLFSSTPALATRLRPLNLEELTRSATRILHGRCLEVRTERDARLGRDVTLVTLQVQRALKGPGASTVTFRQLAGAAPDGRVRSAVVGMPEFRKGEEIILFLAGEAPTGLTAPLGLGQGKFSIFTDKRGQRLAANELGNRALFRGLSERAAARLGPPARPWEAERGVPPETLLDMVDSLQREQP